MQKHVQITDIENIRESLIEQTKIIHILFDRENKLKYINPAFEFYTGYKLKDLTVKILLKIVYQEDKEIVIKQHIRAFDDQTFTTAEIRLVGKDKSITWFTATWHPHLDTLEVFDGVFVTLVDITSRKYLEQKLKESEDNFASLFNSNIIGVNLSDQDGNLVIANDAFLDMLGFTRAEFNLGQVKWTDQTPDEYAIQDQKILKEVINQGKTEPFEKEFYKKDGTRIPVLIGFVRQNNNHNQHVCLIIDISKQKELELKLHHQATHDMLTNLPNRRHFYDTLSLDFESKFNAKSSVVFIDIDDFKKINDTFGHHIGDNTLIILANTLKQNIRSSDTLARIGGDEFVILFKDLSKKSLLTMLQRICDDLEEPQIIKEHQISISISIGIVYGLHKYTKPEHILNFADKAMYKAKANGKGKYFFI